MPSYELSILLKALPRTEITAALKRIGTALLDQGTTLQKLENLGQKDLPYRMTQDGQAFTKGHHFVFTFIGSPKKFNSITEVCKKDLDFLRYGIGEVYKDLSKECTLESEMLPPALRPSVHKLIDKGRKYREKRKFRYRHERDYKYFDIYM